MKTALPKLWYTLIREGKWNNSFKIKSWRFCTNKEIFIAAATDTFGFKKNVNWETLLSLILDWNEINLHLRFEKILYIKRISKSNTITN